MIKVNHDTNNNCLYYYNVKAKSDNYLCDYISSRAFVIYSNTYQFKQIEFFSIDKKIEQLNVPIEFFSKNSDKLENLLRQYGFNYPADSKMKKILFEHLVDQTPNCRLTLLTSNGWSSKFDAYNLFDEVIANSDKYISTKKMQPSKSSSIDNTIITSIIKGNSRLIIAVGALFSAPLLRLLNIQSFGIHFFGSSSIGKTSLLNFISTFIGGKKTINSWEATKNGIVGLAKQYNDMPLLLDEISQFRSHDAIEQTIMTLINGQETARLDKNSELKKIDKWVNVIISTGNQSIAELNNRTTSTATDIRIINIKAEVTDKSLFENTHQYANSYALVKYIESISNENIELFKQFINHLLELNSDEISKLTTSLTTYTTELAPPNSHSQVLRVAEKFAIIIISLKLATYYNVINISYDEIEQNVKLIFNEWLSGFGLCNRDETKILNDFIANLQSKISKFVSVDAEKLKLHLPDPLFGYIDDDNYYVNAAAMRALLQNHNYNFGLEVLAKYKILNKPNSKTSMKTVRIGRHTQKLYEISKPAISEVQNEMF